MSEQPTSDLPPGVHDALLRYMASREDFRDQRVARWYDTLTRREKALVREIAVMAFVQGTRHAGAFAIELPPDSAVTAMTIDACFSFPELYPTVDRIERAATRRARREARNRT